MRILITIPHFFNPAGNGRYGSTQPNPQPRIAALTQVVRSLHTLYAGAQEYWVREGEQLQPRPANHLFPIAIDIVICTSLDFHLLDQLVLPPNLYERQRIDCEPPFLGFACHTVLQERLGDYDLYGYMEDDLILHDPDFFTKLQYVQQLAGDVTVLQPNRYERYGTMAEFKKVYIDFEFHAPARGAVQDAKSITIESFNRSVELHPATNGHAGCFFLNQAQMDHWARQPYFGTRDTSYVGPLESAATLGLIRTFNVYKPAPQNANFLEVEHAGQAWSHRLAAVRFAKGT